ncbi:MAG: hypothetical protein JXB17_11370 [Bacteroidales bacterium]|nr:hypothetical protein [Bacteroidales bacterium]
MKTILFIFTIILISFSTYSQKLEKEIDNIKRIEIYNLYGQIHINGNKSDRIIIERTDPESPKNLLFDKSAKKYKTDNTQLGLNFEYNNETLIVFPANEKSLLASYSIDIPRDKKLKISNDFQNLTDTFYSIPKEEIFNQIIIKNMKNELDINTFISNIKITNYTGPLVLSGFYGYYSIDYSVFKEDNHSTVNLINGDIEFLLPYYTNMDLALNVLSGKVMSDFVLKNATIKTGDNTIKKKKIPNSELKKYTGIYCEGIVNKGGTKLNLSLHKGNIKLRATDYPYVVTPVYVP